MATIWIRWSYYYATEWSIKVAERAKLDLLGNIHKCEFLFPISGKDVYKINEYPHYADRMGAKCDICGDRAQKMLELLTMRECWHNPSMKTTYLQTAVCNKCHIKNVDVRIGAILGAFARLRKDLVDDIVSQIILKIIWIRQ